jgi:tetratricopeptide (TPR) repeat protein
MTATSAQADLAARPPRDSRLEPYLQTIATYRTLFTLAGMTHAGAEENPRPLPQTSLYDFKRHCAAGAPSGRGPVPDALYFAFYSAHYRVAPELAITVPAEHLWWLASDGDQVLLSDRATRHYTSVASVDREEKRVYFYDPWPDEFFLLPDRNTFGIAARSSPGLNVSKEEFLRVLVGLVTWDTPKLVQHYLAAFPDQRKSHDTLIRFGFALLDPEADLFAPMAAILFLDAARVAPDDAARDMAARQAYLAAACGAYFANARGDRQTFAAMESLLRDVMSAHGRAALDAGLSARELTRLGDAAGNAGDHAGARAIFDRAIAKDPEFENAYRSRAVARAAGGDAVGAADDAARAIELNNVALERLLAARAAIDPRGHWELQHKDGEIGDLRERRMSELAILVNACVALREFAQARDAARTLIELCPNQAMGHFKLAMVEREAGCWAEAAAALQQAIARERDPKRRTQYELLRAEMLHRAAG